MPFCDFVDGDLLVVKAIFFFFFSGAACIYPYVSVYMQQVGLLPSQIGLIKSAGNFMSIIIKPVLGSIADKTGRSKLVAVLTVMTASALLFSMLFIPPVPSTTTSRETREKSHLADQDKSDGNTKDTQSWFSLTFWLFFWIFFLSHGVYWSSVSQVEAASYQTIKRKGRGQFGRQRLFGSVGFSIFAFVSGFAMDTFTDWTKAENQGKRTSVETAGNKTKTDYSVAFYMFLTFMILTVCCLLKLKDWSAEPSTGFLKDVGKLLSQLHLLIFLIAVLLLGALDAASETFLLLHLKDLGASQTVLGVFLFVRTAAEIPVYVISTWIITKLGYTAVLGCGFAAIGLRFLLYSFITNPWWAVAIDTLNGYHALLWAAMTSYVSISAQDDLQTVAQGIVATTFYGLGHMLGNLVGGVVYNRYGAVAFFRSFSVSCLIGFLLFYLLYRCFGKKQNPTERRSDTEDENETQTPLVLTAGDVAESQALKQGTFLRGGSVTSLAGKNIGFLRLVKPQDRDIFGLKQ
ncbi:hypothetical protein Bbelb_278080 [Branchiostoma belcheri]|nr:hypothetical protein Bbelb_278080 [Branchiostoma belcheri]